MIYVCPLNKVDETISLVGARRIVSLLAHGTDMQRPSVIAEGNHLLINMHDIAEAQDGMTLPGHEHVERIIAFGKGWDRGQPLVVNCYAGISRSTATAYLLAAALSPSRDEVELAQALRKLSPTATPNPRIIAIADELLGREGRMTAAIAAIGRGAEAFEGVPFGLRIDG
ncbi:MAG TPA: protein tyrosine phosphatase [Mesorhizobium sp.]|jgi:predicted protein tyrosine phosphatase